jgi:hypothetical protein
MGKYIAYLMGVVVILLALEFFQIVDIPYIDFAGIESTGEEYKEKSEERMKQKYGD